MLEEFKEMLNEHSRDTLPSVLFVSSECAPLAKTGGLADVVGTLPKALKKLGMDARVITPFHRVTKEKYKDKVEHMFHFYVNLGWRHEYCGIEKLDLDGVIIYLVDSEAYYGDKIYRGGAAEIEQYAFFQRAVLDALPNLDFNPEIIHCNDWQSGMVPMLARTQYRGCMQEKMKYLISIHNIAYQGRWNFEFIDDLFGIDKAYFTPEYIELNKDANFLKAGCVFSDRLSTVSPNYANEIKTAYFGEGLEGILNARSHQLTGILNGIDTEVFNPQTDRTIPANYSKSDISGKALCKEGLQRKLGLEINPDVPIIGMVTRMTEQKGFELVMTVLDDLMTYEDVQFVLLGTGDQRYEEFMRNAENKYRGRLCSYIGYDEELSHLVYAGSDFFLMPSRFEPCGLSQMIAMRYGCLPIVRETGGLKDSVNPYNCITGEGDGFSFANFDAWEMRATIHYALSFYKDKKVMESLIDNAMNEDFSFERSAKEYVRLYISMLDGYHETPPAILHECTDIKYRTPFGAVEQGEEVKISFNILSGRVIDAVLVLRLEDEKIEYPMERSKDSYRVKFNAPDKVGAWRYYFRIETKYGTRFIAPDQTGFTANMYNYESEGFSFTVYLKGFETPEWFKSCVMYQIFPDRFGFYGKSGALRGIKYHKELGQTPSLHKSLDEDVKYLPADGEEDYYPDDFYGGTLKGIQAKLPYLKDLGISVIYLNPIVEARSNHRYDTSNYLNVDPILGTVQDFEALCEKGKKLGIKIILDGVYSHTGSDSIYFDRYGHYGNTGACSGQDSQYYKWFSFDSFPNDYKCWWNFKDLPEVDERNEQWQNYIIKNDDSVMKTWLKRGASGWRLDVADEIPDDVLSLMRSEVKKEDKDALIIGEVWEDAVTKYGSEGPRNYVLGYSLDSVMNYPFRFAVLDFLSRRKSAYDLRNFLLNQKFSYPKPVYESLMNLLSSHDVDRIRTALSTDVVIRDLTRQEQIELTFSDESLKKAVELEKLAAVLQFVLPGVPCIYYGDEQGMMGVCDPFNRMPFKEDDENTGLYEFYKKLAEMRKSSLALSRGDVQLFALSDDVITILRYDDIKKSESALAIINRGDYDFNYKLNLKEYNLGTVKGKIPALKAEIRFI